MATNDELRSALGKIGIWMPPPAAAGVDPAGFGRDIEQAGFRSVWFPGVNDPNSLEYIEHILAGTAGLIVGTGIASVWTWEPKDLAARTEHLASAYPGRFILGLGVSHAPAVEATGQAYVRPLAKMREFLDEFAPTAAPVVLAALGPKMLELSRDRTAGAHPYFAPPAHTKFAREVLGAEPLLIPEIAVALADGEEGLAHARAYARFYLQLPNYTNNLKKFGFTAADIDNGGSQRLINTVVPNAAAPAVARIREHLGAGADNVLVQLVGPDGKFAAGDLGQLASLLRDLL
ncbi:MAG TPA: TIGR03620 family F420-dependent LLM class oxidoreductase [Streptosporangiaceae bacterium]|jgi:probable F420-dependent oxidoreductase